MPRDMYDEFDPFVAVNDPNKDKVRLGFIYYHSSGFFRISLPSMLMFFME